MKKLLLGTAVVAMGAALSTPASAQVSLELGGHFKGYVSWLDQDTTATQDVTTVDMLRETEIHFTGETTLDNGLTVGFHAEADVDDGEFGHDESYLYMSGHWGRVNVGSEDGAAYLLQVAAPSADSNVDGIRQYINPINGIAAGLADADTDGVADILEGGIDYDNDATGDEDKITYMTPVFNGFQAGVSYTFDVDDFASTSRSLGGNGLDDVAGEHGQAYEGAVRYEGQWDQLGVALGAGYARVELEEDTGTEDDLTEWNVGADFDWGAFGLGVVWTENDNASDTNDENETLVVGADYTTGPYKIGASWFSNENDISGTDVETDRYSVGLIYTYGPGMTFRGSVGYLEQDTAASDFEATYALVGTQVNF